MYVSVNQQVYMCLYSLKVTLVTAFLLSILPLVCVTLSNVSSSISLNFPIRIVIYLTGPQEGPTLFNPNYPEKAPFPDYHHIEE